MIVSAILMGVFLTMLIVMLVDWKETTGHYPRMKFKDFKKFYAINPKRWVLHASYVSCYVSPAFDDEEVFMFNFVDHWRYKLWFKNKEKRKENKSNMEATQRMLNAVQEDVKKHQSDAERDIVESLRGTIDALNKFNMNDTALSLVNILKQIEKQQPNDTKLTE